MARSSKSKVWGAPLPDPQPYCNKATSLMHAGRYKAALLCLKHVEAGDEMAFLVSYNRGRAYSGLGKHGEALRCCDGALGSNPDFFPAAVLKADCLEELGRHGEAGEWRRRAEKLGARSSAAA